MPKNASTTKTETRREAWDYGKTWHEAADIPPEALCAAIWSFLASGPGDLEQAARIVGHWGVGLRGPCAILKDHEVLWMRPALLSACNSLGMRGRIQNSMRLLGRILDTTPGSLRNQLSRWLEVTEVDPVKHFDSGSSMATRKVRGSYRSTKKDGTSDGRLVIPTRSTSAAYERAYMHNLLDREDGPDARVLGIKTIDQPPAFSDWIKAIDPDRVQWGGGTILMPFCRHAIHKYAIADKTSLRLMYEFSAMDEGQSGNDSGSLRLYPIGFRTVGEIKFKSFGHGGMKGLVGQARLRMKVNSSAE